MSKTNRWRPKDIDPSNPPSDPRQSNAAKGMITAGTGRCQKFGDKRMKRSKDFKRSWKNEDFG